MSQGEDEWHLPVFPVKLIMVIGLSGKQFRP